MTAVFMNLKTELHRTHLPVVLHGEHADEDVTEGKLLQDPPLRPLYIQRPVVDVLET